MASTMPTDSQNKTINASFDVAAALECLSRSLPTLRDRLLAEPTSELSQRHLAAGEVLLHEGETAHALYVVTSGRLRAVAVLEDGSPLTLSEFGPGELAGEMAILLGGGVYGATVSAVTDAVLVRVSREHFEHVVAAAPQILREMTDSMRRRLARDQLAIGLLRLFGKLDEAMLRFVEARVDWVRLRAGEVLFTEGEKADDLYFIVGGRLRAVASDGRVLNEMTRGESIG